jgi:hypothetical protein
MIDVWVIQGRVEMSMKYHKFMQILQLSSMMILIVACGSNTVTIERVWSESTAAPGNFDFWVGSGQTVKLPVHKDEFINIISSLGGKFYITGEGEARSLSAPPPRKNSPCALTSRALVINFGSISSKYNPTYIAYFDQFDLIQCVDKQFSYSSQPDF